MGQKVQLKASDGHSLGAYLAEAAGKPRGAVVIIQEIFGVTRHIRAVTDQYAGAGFTAIAPALFDRIEADIDVPYSDMQKGFGYMQQLKNEQVMLDIKAGMEHIAASGKLATVGYCWGGTMSYLAAARLDLSAAVAYYGGGIDRYLAEKPRCPVLFHYGEKDAHIPLSTVDQVKSAVPQGVFHIYPADHGFNCTDRASFDAAASKLAFERSIEFLTRHLS
jgi:carboxymethylenebutenolidase